ncbi:Acyl-coenzyme A thioesterase PaaI, contains HGG motif [Dethiosulfatibacter aminovorans DSM 17477]|uniref:Acyl-coenzyme A thioesterase PaaI, contains HGG motif n=1 Tax=Dethiosulfatibacter aminovorans DSM 17477 TaxID=1121476 RepID=A0A1M6EY13_9FIRM|nr:DUF4442 domain-containing protein [Dethiosulfatibacter aminovorans]SHI90323.1 Acyl-coenzyme A thioesterase PaaI, contains HGG motif [Dethiosulfatibacter aminovorans DSM 17477]
MEHLNVIREAMKNPPIKWMKDAGFSASIIEKGHVKVHLDVKELHLNHVNIVYAGSMYAFAEMAGGALIQSVYGFDKWVPILKKAEIKYVKASKSDLVCELKMTEEEAKANLEPIEERGRGEYPYTVEVKDIEGNTVAIVDFTYYLLPFTNNLEI